MPDTIPYPQCGAPARITERFWLDTTDGPAEHLKTGRLSKHGFTPRAETVQSEQVATPDRDLAVLPSCRCPQVHASSTRVWHPSRMAGGHADVPALWSCRLSLPELAVRRGRTRRLWPPT
jgi:hypothetical protein